MPVRAQVAGPACNRSGPPRHAAESRHFLSNPSTPTVSILVVEDEPAVAELIRTILSDVDGWGATVAHDAALARAVFQQVQIDVLVLDLNLPGISGLELLELLRQDATWTDPPVIIVSAAADDPAMRQALKSVPVTRLLHKPFDIDLLVASIQAALQA